MGYLAAALAGLSAVLLVVCIIQNIRSRSEIRKIISENEERFYRLSRMDLQKTGAALSDEINRSRQETLDYVSVRFRDYSMLNEQKLENIRVTMESRIEALTEDNNVQLERMRNTVDEKLQKTLETRISQSFRLVNERLEQVYRGLGEMQSLAAGVGDLKKVLSNVKSRGILGEIQLGAILSEILSPDQYEENVRTTSGTERVEYAVRMPGAGDSITYLPIDAKFPGDAYHHLMDAYESGDREAIRQAGRALDQAIKSEAKDICTKYIEPPYSTDFAVMFLPFEGLYAEVVRRGLVEELQRNYRVNIAGPTTMAALLSSLQMGFRTLAIQRHSGEVWNTLSAVKTEFGKFEDVLTKAQNKIEGANKELERLIGTRTRMMYSKLKDVEKMELSESEKLLGIVEENEEP